MSLPVSGTSGPTAVGYTTSAAPAASTGINSMLNSQTFLQLLVDQLKYQDPLNPTSGSELMSQVAQLSQVEALQQLNQSSQNQSGSEQTLAAASLIGRSVTAAGSSGPVQGVVDSVDITPNGVTLSVAGHTVTLAQIQSIAAA